MIDFSQKFRGKDHYKNFSNCFKTNIFFKIESRKNHRSDFTIFMLKLSALPKFLISFVSDGFNAFY